MAGKTWDYASGLCVTLSDNKFEWVNNQRGNEWGADQTTADFLSNGPLVGISSVPKDILREILAALGKNEAPWLPAPAQEPTITLIVLGHEVRFIDDAWLKAHDNAGVKDIVDRFDKTAEEFWRSKKLWVGHLAEDTHLLQYVFKTGTELLLHDNGNLFIGTLAAPARVNGCEFAAGSNLIFHKDGTVESGELVGTTKIGSCYYYGRVGFFPDGSVSSGSLARPAVIGGVKCAQGPAYFNPDGSVRAHQ